MAYSDRVAKPAEQELITVAGRDVAISNPRKVLFPQAGYTKLDVVRYYVSVADGALRGSGNRPNILVRYPNGIDSEFGSRNRARRKSSSAFWSGSRCPISAAARK